MPKKTEYDTFSGRTPQAHLIISDPEDVVRIMHTKKNILLRQIFFEAKTIQEIRKETRMNPGTIKRHLEDLIEAGLVFEEGQKRNEYNILMKYYRAAAREFIINIHVP